MTDTNPQLRILREEHAWAVVEKPHGLLSVPGKGDEPRKKICVPLLLRQRIPRAAGPLIVHRLDMDTSGLMVLALTPDAQRALSRQFEQRTVDKRYTALLDGIVPHTDRAEVRLPLRPEITRRPWQITDALHGRDALTRWRTLAHEIDRTRVELTPVTGRAHQLRVHAATSAARGGIGACIIGDVLYGTGYTAPPPPPEAQGTLAPARRLMLHASFLAFTDPDTGLRIESHSPAPF